MEIFSRLPTGSLRLSELFAPPFVFSIPPYQRPYSWTTHEAMQLLEDVSAAAGLDDSDTAEPDYFLGAILLLEKLSEDGEDDGNASSHRTFEIVDGQQRLVTLTILACVLRDLDENGASEHAQGLQNLVTLGDTNSETDQLRLTLRGAEQDFLLQHVQLPGACRNAPEDPDIMSPGEKALLGARDVIVSELERLEPGERAALATYLAQNCHFVVILTKDLDRAHRMFSILNDRGRPLQRNDILKAEILRGVSEERRPEILRHWEEAERGIGAHFEDFFSHLRLVHGQSKQQKVIAGVRAVVKSSGGPEPFVLNEFTPLARAYRAILEVRTDKARLDPAIHRVLLCLSRLSGSDWIPATLLVLRDFDKDPEVARKLLPEIERYASLLRILCLGAGKRQRRFVHVVEALRSGEAWRDPEKTFAFSREDMRAIAHNMRDLYARNMQACKLALMRVNDELQEGGAELNPSDFSVEHVLPQRPKASSVWRQWFPDPEERQACTSSLGNLVLVTQAQNDRARNEDFSRKQAVYRTPDGPHGVLTITDDAVSVEKWDAELIRRREAWIIAELIRIWRLDLPGQPRAKS